MSQKNSVQTSRKAALRARAFGVALAAATSIATGFSRLPNQQQLRREVISRRW